MMERWYPEAVQRPIDRNFELHRETDARPILAIVLHIADGLGSPFNWFNRASSAGDSGSSAAFWVSQEGAVEQYRPLDDICWSNGIIARPNLAIPTIRLMWLGGWNPNAFTVAIEHEGRSGYPLTEVQRGASRALTRWILDQAGLRASPYTILGHSDLDAVTRARCPGFALESWWDCQGALPRGGEASEGIPRAAVEELLHRLWPNTETIAHRAVAIQQEIGSFKSRVGIG